MADGSFLYTPAVPATSKFSNTDLNSLASTYASSFSHQTTALIQRIVKELIFDAAPQQFFDLKLLNQKPFESIKSDEWFFHEMDFGRNPLTTDAADGGGGATQVISVAAATDLDHVAIDTILVYPDNSHATVTTVTAGGPSVTVTSMTGQTLPAIAIGDNFAVLSPVEADGANSISQYFRIETTERFNFVQMLVKAMRFGRMELFKYENAGTTSNYLSMQKQRMLQQFRIDISNILWNGERGEVTLSNSAVAKTTGGIFPSMVAAGSPNSSVTLANSPQALEELALDTEFKAFGATRFFYATPRLVHFLAQEYKRSLTRYSPNDEIAKLDLKAIDIGSTKVVFVPMKRFEEPSCFPAAWRSRGILLDQETLSCVQTWGEEMGETLSRVQGGTRENFKDFWVSTTFGVQFNNPLASGFLDITDLP